MINTALQSVCIHPNMHNKCMVIVIICLGATFALHRNRIPWLFAFVNVERRLCHLRLPLYCCYTHILTDHKDYAFLIQ